MRPVREWHLCLALGLTLFAHGENHTAPEPLRAYLSEMANTLAWDPSMPPLQFDPHLTVQPSVKRAALNTTACRRVAYKVGGQALPFCGGWAGMPPSRMRALSATLDPCPHNAQYTAVWPMTWCQTT